MSGQIKTEGKQNLQIQALRGIFCIMIILYHMTCRYSAIYADPAFHFFWSERFSFIALTGFFCLSGYFAVGRPQETGVSYFLHRFRRLYPAYLVAITLIFCVQLTGLLGPERSTTFRQYLLNIPFLHVVFRSGFVDGAHWYVVFLLFFYALVAVLKQLGLFQKQWFPALNMGLLLLALAALLLILKRAPEGLVSYLNYYFCFSVGVGFRRYREAELKGRALVATLVLAVAYTVLSEKPIDALVTLIVLAIVYLALIQRLTLLGKIRPLAYLGDRSYMIYLLHQNMGYMAINFLLSRGVENAPLCIAAAALLGIVLGTAVYEVLARFKIRC